MSRLLTLLLLQGACWCAAQAQMAADPAPGCQPAAPPLRDQQLALAAEINLARTDPAAYADLVQAQFAGLGADRVYRRGGLTIRMAEGRSAVDEAVQFLRAAQPVPALALHDCLSLAAQDHVADQGPSGRIGHAGSDGSHAAARVRRHLGLPAACGENISYGPWSAREHVISLLVDDNVPGRGHRVNLLRPGYTALGVGLGPHARYGRMAVQVFCLDLPVPRAAGSGNG